MAARLRLCHLSDPHLAFDRAGSFAILEALLRDALARGADHVLVTGDLLDRPGPAGLAEAVGLFRRLGLWDPGRLTVLPGNHDASGHLGEGRAPARRRRALEAFLDAFRPVSRDLGGPGRARPLAPGRPVIKDLGPLVLAGICTASDHHDVEGRVVPADLAALARRLPRPTRRRRLALAVHHHPEPWPVGRSEALGRFVPEGLDGGPELLRLCADLGVDLVLHGHIHTSGGPFDRRVRGVKVRCQGTAKGERTAGGRRRYGYDLYTYGGARLARRRRFLTAGDVVEGLLAVELEAG